MDLIAPHLVRVTVQEQWGRAGAEVVPHHGGMNSQTWFVTTGAERWVAKAVPADRADDFTGGLQVAAHLERAGAALSTPDGRSTVPLAGHRLALLAFVPGEPLTGHDQREVGDTLARVHRTLRHANIDGVVRPFHWVDPGAPHLDARPWLRPAVTAAVDALAGRTWTEGLLHTDPAPEAFRPGGGLIDWSVALRGPLLYDLASAVMYVGGPAHATELIESYLATAPLPRAEAGHGLAPMLRFRWAVQADYFARRIATGDLTGIDGPAGNEKGLADAERALIGRRA
jgi:Ser/Thr protein kinase RdoA (MazF antagonist)